MGYVCSRRARPDPYRVAGCLWADYNCALEKTPHGEEEQPIDYPLSDNTPSFLRLPSWRGNTHRHLMLLTGWRRMEKWLLGFALAVLWIQAMPIFAHWLSWRVELKLPLLSIETLPLSDVMILLGGATDHRFLRCLAGLPCWQGATDCHFRGKFVSGGAGRPRIPSELLISWLSSVYRVLFLNLETRSLERREKMP